MVENNERYTIVSSWDWKEKPDWKRLISIIGKCEIFHQGKIQNLNYNFLKNIKITKTKHTGSNISDYFKFILDNYPYFPKELGLIKSNLIERHIDFKHFKKYWKSKAFIPLFFQEITLEAKKDLFNRFIFQQISPGFCIEKTNNWYIKHGKPGKFYEKIEDLFWFITKKKIPNFISMVPGASMIVTSDKILRWKKSFYERLYEASSYQDQPNPMPVECWHIERLMLYIFFYEKY
jgi:hypothetical protein